VGGCVKGAVVMVKVGGARWRWCAAKELLQHFQHNLDGKVEVEMEMEKPIPAGQAKPNQTKPSQLQMK